VPAANPRRLESQVEALVGLIHDPNLLQKQAVEILTYYADRTRRPGVQRSTRVDPPQLNVPSSVLRTLRTRLKQALDIVPDQAVPVADAMWEAGLRETQLLAVSILGCMRSAESSAWVEARFPSCRDPHVLARLADEGLAAWRLGNPQAFLERAAEGYERMRFASVEGDAAPWPPLTNVAQLVQMKLIRGLPAAPAGQKFVIDPKTMKVSLASQ